MPGIQDSAYSPGQEALGLTHLAFSVDREDEVDGLVWRAREEGRRIILDPHQTGDGYYEACCE